MHEVNLHVHTHYLEKHIAPGNKVLEIGAGPGRFTQVLARLGAQVVVGDISNVELVLNRRFAAELGFDQAVLDRQQVDICDLSQFEMVEFLRLCCRLWRTVQLCPGQSRPGIVGMPAPAFPGRGFTARCHVTLGNDTWLPGWCPGHACPCESDDYQHWRYHPCYLPGTKKQFYAPVSSVRKFVLSVPSVLSGKNSFVGPKKPLMFENEVLGKTGLTGLWYIDEGSFTDTDKLDFYYVKNQNIWLDLEILGKTLNQMWSKGE